METSVKRTIKIRPRLVTETTTPANTPTGGGLEDTIRLNAIRRLSDAGMTQSDIDYFMKSNPMEEEIDRQITRAHMSRDSYNSYRSTTPEPIREMYSRPTSSKLEYRTRSPTPPPDYRRRSPTPPRYNDYRHRSPTPPPISRRNEDPKKPVTSRLSIAPAPAPERRDRDYPRDDRDYRRDDREYRRDDRDYRRDDRDYRRDDRDYKRDDRDYRRDDRDYRRDDRDYRRDDRDYRNPHNGRMHFKIRYQNKESVSDLDRQLENYHKK